MTIFSTFKCFVCGRNGPLKAKRRGRGLTCVPCYGLIESMPIGLQRLLARVLSRLWTLESEKKHGR